MENYNGEYLATQDVIFVSVNYRLGIFGWLGADALAAEDPEGSTGNYGLMDLIKALQWVRDNIEQFGGNPNNITLYGGSAGGNLIDMLMISPKAEGLFQHACSMSYSLDMISPAWDMSAKTGIGNGIVPDAASLEEMRKKTPEEVMENPLYLLTLMFAGPTIDGTYIDTTFKEGIEAGRSKNVDYITGINYNDEYPTQLSEEGFPDDSQWLAFVDPNGNGENAGDILRLLMNASAISRAKGGAADNTYTLQFEHCTATPYDYGMAGAVHGGDVAYMLHYFSDNRAAYWRDEDFRVGDLASAYFINFCRTGNPNGTTAAGEALPEWKTSTGDYTYFTMDVDCENKEMDKEKVETVITYLEDGYGYNFLRKNPKEESCSSACCSAG